MCKYPVSIMIKVIFLIFFSINVQGPSADCAAKTTFRELNAEAKQAILDLHNDLRRKVAKGEEINGINPPQPGATNMRKLVRKCFLINLIQNFFKIAPKGLE